MADDELDGVASADGEVEEGDQEVIPGMLYIKPDGRIVRLAPLPLVPANAQFVDGVASKYVPVDTDIGIWGRVYLSESVAKKGPDVKAPVVVFYHGGGFCVASPDHPFFNRLCEETARASDAVVVSMSYRLAPEHRLPSAYKDAFTSILWLQKQAALQAKGEGDEPWLIHHADFSKCFVMGESAGANIVHHLGVRFAETDLHPLSIRGLISLVLYCGKEERSESELLYGADDLLAPLPLLDEFWKLALPVGATRSHPYCNIPSGSDQELPSAKVLMVVAKTDPMNSGQMEYYNALKRAGRNVQLVEVPEGGHGFRHLPQFAHQLPRVDQAIRAFVHE